MKLAVRFVPSPANSTSARPKMDLVSDIELPQGGQGTFFQLPDMH